MKIRLGLTVLLLLTACGSTQPYVSPSIQSYVNEFFDQCTKHEIITCKQRFEERIDFIKLTDKITDPQVLGTCYTDKLAEKSTILINHQECIKDEYQCKYTVWHELGHCLYGLEHTDNGLMAAYSVPIYTDEIINEYFLNIKEIENNGKNIIR